MSTFYVLPADDAEVTLHTHLSVREDAHVLYGFAREADRTLFRALAEGQRGGRQDGSGRAVGHDRRGIQPGGAGRRSGRR